MVAKKQHLHAGFRLWVSSGETEGVFGDGKWRLLEAIEKEGSLKAASQALEISYRKAWGDLRKTERSLGVCFVEKRRGGAGGGEAVLTDAGRRWLAAYGRFRSEVERAVSQGFRRHLRPLV